MDELREQAGEQDLDADCLKKQQVSGGREQAAEQSKLRQAGQQEQALWRRAQPGYEGGNQRGKLVKPTAQVAAASGQAGLLPGQGGLGKHQGMDPKAGAANL